MGKKMKKLKAKKMKKIKQLRKLKKMKLEKSKVQKARTLKTVQKKQQRKQQRRSLTKRGRKMQGDMMEEPGMMQDMPADVEVQNVDLTPEQLAELQQGMQAMASGDMDDFAKDDDKEADDEAEASDDEVLIYPHNMRKRAYARKVLWQILRNQAFIVFPEENRVYFHDLEKPFEPCYGREMPKR